jgi:tRNA modification GTPase
VVQGIPIQVLDTAGIRDTEDTVEKIGVERSHQAAQNADLVLFTLDAQVGWTVEDEAIYERVRDRPLILVINKIDLGEVDSTYYPAYFMKIVKTSAAKNQGIAELEQAIIGAVKAEELSIANLDFAINQRQAAALRRSQLSLRQVQETITEELPLDFWTIDLRSAIQALGEITGEDVTDSVLERIFSRFCIGK